MPTTGGPGASAGAPPGYTVAVVTDHLADEIERELAEVRRLVDKLRHRLPHHPDHLEVTVSLIIPAGGAQRADYLLTCTLKGAPVAVPAGVTWEISNTTDFVLTVSADGSSASVKDAATSAAGATTTVTVTVPLSADGSIPPDVTVLNLSNAAPVAPVFPDAVSVAESLGPVV